MDFFDLLSAFPPTVGGGPSRDRPAEDQAALAVGCGLFPILDFLVVLFVDGARHGVVALGAPVGFAVLTVLLCRRLCTGTGAAILATAGCVFFCLIASGTAFLLAAIAGFYSTF